MLNRPARYFVAAMFGVAVVAAGFAVIADAEIRQPISPGIDTTTLAAFGPQQSSTPGASPIASPLASPFASAPVPAKVDVAIRGFMFDPPVVEVAIGGTVTWTNYDFVPHDVTSKTEGADVQSPILSSGQSFSFTFTDTGSYDYFCSLHPSMVGKIVVVKP